MSKKKWREINNALLQVAGEAAAGVGQLRGKSGTRAQPFDESEDIADKFDRSLTPEQKERTKRHMDRLLGNTPLRETPPHDMPAIEKIKIYAKAGYKHYYNGTDEDFERVWEEAFKKKGKYKLLLDSLREKGEKE